MISTLFKISNKDYVKIGNTQYDQSAKIDTVLSSNFTVTFHSNKAIPKAFILQWNCLTQWTEWITTDDGTCRESMKLQPEYKGPDLKHRTKYRKIKNTCRKLILGARQNKLMDFF